MCEHFEKRLEGRSTRKPCIEIIKHFYETYKNTSFREIIMQTISLFLFFQLVCSICCQHYSSKQMLRFHMRAMHRIGGEPPTCKWCGRDDIKTRTPFFRHLRECKKKHEEESRRGRAAEIEERVVGVERGEKVEGVDGVLVTDEKEEDGDGDAREGSVDENERTSLTGQWKPVIKLKF